MQKLKYSRRNINTKLRNKPMAIPVLLWTDKLSASKWLTCPIQWFVNISFFYILFILFVKVIINLVYESRSEFNNIDGTLKCGFNNDTDDGDDMTLMVVIVTMMIVVVMTTAMKTMTMVMMKILMMMTR